jgi:hypothetical protein
VEEGVDVLSLLLGDDEAGDFAYDPIALGGYTAIMEGVFVSAAGGKTARSQQRSPTRRRVSSQTRQPPLTGGSWPP